MGKMNRAGKFKTLAACGAAALALWSCAPHAAPAGRLGLKLSPAALGASVSLQQHLVVEREGRIDELDAALEIDERRLDLVGLALGQRVLTLHYDGRALDTWPHPMLPPGLRGEDVLEDIQLALRPAAALRRGLPPRGPN